MRFDEHVFSLRLLCLYSRMEPLGSGEVQSEDDQCVEVELEPPNWQTLVSRDVLSTLTPQEIKRQEVINGEWQVWLTKAITISFLIFIISHKLKWSYMIWMNNNLRKKTENVFPYLSQDKVFWLLPTLYISMHSVLRSSEQVQTIPCNHLSPPCHCFHRVVLHRESTCSNDEGSGKCVLPAADQRGHPASCRHQKHLQQPWGDRSAAWWNITSQPP